MQTAARHSRTLEFTIIIFGLLYLDGYTGIRTPAYVKNWCFFFLFILLLHELVILIVSASSSPSMYLFLAFYAYRLSCQKQNCVSIGSSVGLFRVKFTTKNWNALSKHRVGNGFLVQRCDAFYFLWEKIIYFYSFTAYMFSLFRFVTLLLHASHRTACAEHKCDREHERERHSNRLHFKTKLIRIMRMNMFVSTNCTAQIKA